MGFCPKLPVDAIVTNCCYTAREIGAEEQRGGIMQAIKKLLRQPMLWLGASLLLSLFLLAYPIYVIRPFRYQGASELAFALAIVRFRPAILIALSVAAVFMALLCWRRQRCSTWQRVAASLCAGLVVMIAFLSRINMYELMFHPIDRATFSRASGVKLDDKEEVIAIQVNREARAYPVRSMSYHHIVNDELGGLPVVATY
jgi:hypothetical protein